MTRKHFEAIAATLKDYRYNEDHASICRDLANEFQALAKNFDKVKFMTACGYDVQSRINEDTGQDEGYYQLTAFDSSGNHLHSYLMKL